MRVTIAKPGVYSPYGIAWPVGSIQTPEDGYAVSLICSQQALDTDGVMGAPPNMPFTPFTPSQDMTPRVTALETRAAGTDSSIAALNVSRTNDEAAMAILIGLANGPNTDPTFMTLAPTTGQTVTIPDNCSSLLLKPAGTLLALTVKFPVNPKPKQLARVFTTQNITVLTMSANTAQTLSTAFAALLSFGAGLTFLYDDVSSTWNRTQ